MPKGVSEHSRSHSRSQPQYKQPRDAPEAYGRSRDRSADPLASKSGPSISNGSERSQSTDRGRTMQRRYEFIDSDDNPHVMLSPVQETTKKNTDDDNAELTDKVGRESTLTTMTDLMQKCAENSPPEMPACQIHRRKPVNAEVGISVAQPSRSQTKAKYRPPPLNLKNAIHVGRVRHADRYDIEHNAVKSSKAEHFGIYSPKSNSSIYDGRVKDPPRISPPDIPDLNELRDVPPLELYAMWRKNLQPVRTASQGSVHITVPIREQDTFVAGTKADEDQLPISDYQVAQDTPIVNRVRSRSALDIREKSNKEERLRQFSGDSIYTDSEYSAEMTAGPGSGVVRSATMHDVHHYDRQLSGGSKSNLGRHRANMNDMSRSMDMENTSPPFTPLTPFIMKVSGAPAGVERGTKKMFGEHGWLEDTAALGAAKPKLEKVSGFMGNMKRRARGMVSHIFTWIPKWRESCIKKLTHKFPS